MHIETAAPSGPKPFYAQLYVQVLAAITAGILLGHFYPEFGASLKPLGDAFVKLVKMIIAPVIFLTVTTGIAGMSDMKKVGRVAGKAMLYFLTFSTLALVVGLVVANLVQPGAGMNIDPATLDAEAVAKYADKAHETTIVGFLMSIIPDTVVSAFSEGNILQVLFFSVLFGLALGMTGDHGKPVLTFMQNLTYPIFRLVAILMKAAPIGAFGAMAFTIGKYGIGSVVNLAFLVFCFYLTAFLFVAIVLGAVARYNGFSVFKLIRYLKEELLLVLGTSSSEAALPSLIQKMERAGASRSVVGLVVPTVPVAGMALILGVDRFMSEVRALTNFIGNAVATLVVARWENELDVEALNAALDGTPKPLTPHAADKLPPAFSDDILAAD